MKIMVNDVSLHLIIGGYIGYFKFLNVMNSMTELKRRRIREKMSCCRNTQYTDHVTNEGRRNINKSNNGQREHVDNTTTTAGQRDPLKQGRRLVIVFIQYYVRMTTTCL
jgi:hypothetical protein